LANWKPLSPSQFFTLDLGVAFGATNTGLLREANQDNFFVSPELGLVAVADGMGGHDAGEIASADAIELLCGFLAAAGRAPAPQGDGDATVPVFRASDFDPASLDPDATWTDATMKAMIALHDAVEFANERMYLTNVAQARPDGTGMGTTLTGMWQPAPGGPLFIFHVGDSRLYLYRDGRLTQLTRDQTLYQEALERGMPEPLPARNLLLQALGPAAEIRPDLSIHTPAPGDVYLLCSDGLYGDSPEADIAMTLGRARADNLDACCARLLAMARRDGGRDNITALLLRCHD